MTSGKLGWGVWCVRDCAQTYMRVYCFGAAIGHIFLMLYLMSKRKTNEQVTVWYAGAGEPAVPPVVVLLLPVSSKAG